MQFRFFIQLTILFLAFSFTSHGQAKKELKKYVPQGHFKYFFDSLRQSMLVSVYKYGTVKEYNDSNPRLPPRTRYFTSPLFTIIEPKSILDNVYLYAFRTSSDSTKMIEFFNQYFDSAIIEKIQIFDFPYEDQFHFTVNENAKFNPIVAGLKNIKKRKFKQPVCKMLNITRTITRYYGENWE